MSQLLNSYPIFEGNQVLTSTQLNQMVAYLDEQNRLTRAKLIGTGIVCGLEVTLDEITSPPLIYISKGMGITSQGYLATLGDCVMNRYKVYNLPDGVSYPPFEDPFTKAQDVALYELITTDAQVLPSDNAKYLNDPSGFLDDKVVMLFIECADIDLKSCLGKSCDDRGKDRVFTLRKLLISKSDLDLKVFPRTCAQTSLFSEKYDLPEIIMQRVLFDPLSQHSSNYFKFSENYVNAVKGNQFVSPFNTLQTNLYEKLFDALRQTYTDFSAILAPVYSTNPFNGLPGTAWTNFLNGGFTPGPRFLGVQYFYDFINDLILAYNEFREKAFDLMSECCMNMNCFPKHLLLGALFEDTTTCKPSIYRHGFVISPAFNNQSQLLEETLMLFKRMVLMTRRFNLSIINNPSTTPIPPAILGQPVFITPSNEKRDPLSERSIPYYFDIHTPDGDLGTLEESWNFEFIKYCLFSKGLKPLGYGNQDIVQSQNQGPVKTPLYFDIDKYNFLRIEGAIRQNYANVVTEIESLKKRFDLPFNVLTLRLSGPPLDNINERCDFDDLRTEYGSLCQQIRSVMLHLFDRFARVSQEGVVLKPLPTFFTELTTHANSGQWWGSVTQAQTGEIPGSAPGLKIPVFAPERTMTQALADLNSNLLQMCTQLARIHQQMLPFNLSDFKFGYTGLIPDAVPGFIQTYTSAMQFAMNVKVDFIQIFDLINRSTKIRNTPELYFNLSAWRTEIMQMLEKFITDGSPKSMMLLNYTYQYRLQFIKNNDQTLFSNFIKKHPGIQHMAGVKRGGTYILLINGDSIAVDVPQRDYAVAQIRELQFKKVEREKIEAKSFKSPDDELHLNALDYEILQLSGIQESLAVGTPVQQIAIDPYQVIADFTLPYLCCCDCECEEVRHPVNAAQLNMPVIAYPFYVEYSLGDYAYPKDLMKGRSNAAEGAVVIDVIAAAQFDHIYSPVNTRIYLIDKFGNLVYYTIPQERTSDEFWNLAFMSTYNYPNDPANATKYGTANLRISTTGNPPLIVYTPVPGFKGVDSFYYIFEVTVPGGNGTLRRSGMGKVTINVTG